MERSQGFGITAVSRVGLLDRNRFAIPQRALTLLNIRCSIGRAIVLPVGGGRRSLESGARQTN